ncbi:hypothetical protein [Halorussus caseinilyticus]|uniref:Uncharacterized protein n=1 Tax=Halorussus caseinilyticus TaxID=3034025 RepID=A0ABD5WNU7_9EURY|nr:hypothetical protein [Halorussus sp. DT72]
MRSGLDYVAAQVDHDGEVYVIDIGRNRIHSAPLLLTTWDDSTSVETRSFAHAVFGPEHLAKSYTPEENVRVTYDFGAEPPGETDLGEWSSVRLYDVGREFREYYRENSGDFYTPAENPVETITTVLVER